MTEYVAVGLVFIAWGLICFGIGRIKNRSKLAFMDAKINAIRAAVAAETLKLEAAGKNELLSLFASIRKHL